MTRRRVVRCVSSVDQAEQLAAAGAISVEDLDEVRTFAAFLEAAGPRPGQPGHDPERRRAALLEYYPELLEGLS